MLEIDRLGCASRGLLLYRVVQGRIIISNLLAVKVALEKLRLSDWPSCSFEIDIDGDSRHILSKLSFRSGRKARSHRGKKTESRESGGRCSSSSGSWIFQMILRSLKPLV